MSEDQARGRITANELALIRDKADGGWRGPRIGFLDKRVIVNLDHPTVLTDTVAWTL